jgi:hypothetical protein
MAGKSISVIIAFMKKLYHLLLICLLILGIPLQSLAAASTLLCDTQTHHQTLSESASLGQHEHAHDAQQLQLDHHTDDQTGDTNSVKLIKDKCSTCASCCVGAAMISGSIFIPVSRPISEKIELVFSSHILHVGDGLERPPRA